MNEEKRRFLRHVLVEYLPDGWVMECRCGCGGYPLNILSADKNIDFQQYRDCPARLARKGSSYYHAFRQDLRYVEAVRSDAFKRRLEKEEEKAAKALKASRMKEAKRRRLEDARALEQQLEQRRAQSGEAPLSAGEARRRGLATYVGQPCQKGHLGERLARNGECLDCRQADNSIRSAMKRGAYPENLTSEEREEILLIYRRCRRISKKTGIPHHVDHIVPLALGGRHHPSNLQILTAEDNLKKGASPPIGYSLPQDAHVATEATLVVRSVRKVGRWLLAWRPKAEQPKNQTSA